ncbi:PIR protein CIR protein [Plasmodium vinckei vinckei]|uniref:PIR protein CIR protein n=1 Tax=Plasmodium vinckei vinckei TaxID=54757 RepID=A0A449BPK6_PLAVN|nr:PIR protein CIR protein [Plasmodium vinckei vinckei]VEV55375.1 PIR protein CIR protein [Plasmodium vinckei vinckei]
MRKNKQMCKLLLEGDSYFNDENVYMEEINKNVKIKGYCSINGCKTNEDRINSVAKYIIMEFKNLTSRKERHNDYDEYLLMWISDKLLKIHKKGKGQNIGRGRMDAFTLKQAYEEYLEKHTKGMDYWVLLDMQQGLKEANLKYMSEFYKLLNKICKIITDYNNGGRNKNIPKYSTDCGRQYKTLYKNISECKSYLDLLNKLKGTYDDFISYAIKKNSSNNDLKTKLQTLTTEDGKVMEAVRSFKTYDFSNEE